MSLSEPFPELADRLRREREPPVRKAHRPVAITGGRDHDPTPEEISRFWTLWDSLGATELHHGDCNGHLFRREGTILGVDQAVAEEMRRRRPAVKIVPHVPDWNAHGKAAGPIRNREMMTHVSALIAFPGGRGTQSCIDAARQQGKQILFVTQEPPRLISKNRRGQRPQAKPPHQHDPLYWKWDSDRAAWIGRCLLCHRFYEATPEEAANLETACADHVEAERLASTPKSA